MKNFSRAISLALQYKVTVVASVVCSIAVAILWAANIATVLPIVDGVMRGKSIPDLIDETVDSSTKQIIGFNKQIALYREKLVEADEEHQNRIRGELSGIQYQLEKAEKSAYFWKRLQPVAREWLPTTPFETLVVICLALFTGTVLKSVFRIAGTYFKSRLGQLTDFELRKEFYRRTLQLDLATFRQTSPGDLMNRFTGEIYAIAVGAQTVFGMALREPLKMIACLCLAAWVSWQLLLLTVLSAPLAIYTIVWLSKALKRANRKAQEEFSSVFDLLEETFGGLQLIKAFTMESRERSRFHQVSKQYYERSMKIALYNSLVSPITEMLGMGMILAAMLAGGYLVLYQETHLLGIRISDTPFTHGMMGLFFASLAGVSDPARRLSGIFNSLQKAAAASDRVYALLDRESQVVDPSVPEMLPEKLGKIHFRDVTFAYHPGEMVLENVNLQIKPGETIAIVGPNGCGKSTLMNLLARFYDPVQGSVTFDGIDLRNVRMRDLRSRFGVVTQDTLLFDDTIANNIQYGSVGASQEEVEEAARQAHAHQFIVNQLPDGYQSLCGTGGKRLSGGQRQRIALARAILRDPEILILDEATSQIDIESEQLIHSVLQKFVQGRTAFMITHRPSTLALADRIIVMEHGQIIDVGTSEDLSIRCELYRRLAHLDYRESA